MHFQFKYESRFNQKIFYSTLGEFQKALTFFGPKPADIYAHIYTTSNALKETKTKIASQLETCSWEDLGAILTSEQPPLQRLVALPSQISTILRRDGEDYFEQAVMFSTRQVQLMYIRAVTRSKTESVLKEYHRTRDSPENAGRWKIWESCAILFLTQRFGCDVWWGKMRTQPKCESNRTIWGGSKKTMGSFNSTDKKKWIFEPRIIDPDGTRQFESSSTGVVVRREYSSVMKRSLPTSPDSQAPLSKRQKLSSTEPSEDTVMGPVVSPMDLPMPLPSPLPSPDIPIPRLTRHVYYNETDEFQAEEGVLYIPNSTMAVLFNCYALYQTRGYLFQVFIREVEGHHPMKVAGLVRASKIFPPDTEIVFVPVVPHDKRAKLMVPFGKGFDDWTYYSLQVEIPRPDIQSDSTGSSSNQSSDV
ncbi:hypothetical protein C8R44DRAFT_888342 [Mycena epipterygia]|nr:hypothetical protein C8R44DRAFT_888342 [Mycena epipterygia]